MTKPDFKILYAGQMIEGADPQRVRANIAKMFKIDISKVDALFTGRRVLLKRGLDAATVEKYRTAFSRAGAIAIIVGPDNEEVAAPVPVTAKPPAPTPASVPAPVQPDRPAASVEVEPPPPTTEPGESATRLQLAEAGRAAPPLVERGTPKVPGDMSMAEAGAMLVDEPRHVETPAIDTSHLTLAEAGADLAEPKRVPTPDHDLSAFELAPPGTALGEDP